MEHETRDLATGSGFGKGYDFAPGASERLLRWIGMHAKRIVKRVLRAAFGTVGQFDAWLHGWERRLPLAPATLQSGRILVVRTDMLGDLVLTLPLIEALHQAYPDAEIDLAAMPSTAGIVQGHPLIARVITCDPNSWLDGFFSASRRREILTIVRTLQAARYDLAVSVCGDWGSIITWLSRARRRVGYAGEAYAHLMTDPVPGGRYQLHRHEVDYVLELAERAGGIVPPPGCDERRPRLYVLDEARAAVAQLLCESGVRHDQPVIALHAGSRNGHAKRWPLPYWARLADALIDAEDVAVVLIGGSGDRSMAQEVLRRMRQPARTIDLTGKTSLPELAALLDACAVVVTGDSGPLHIAEAVRTRVVALHGPTDPVNSGPYGPEAIMLRRDVWCSPCYDPAETAECRFFNPICMKGLALVDVLAATQTQLAKARRVVNLPQSDTDMEEPYSTPVVEQIAGRSEA